MVSSAARPLAPVYATLPTHFDTLSPDARLPAGDECAGLAHAQAFAETKAVNIPFNRVSGHALAHDFFDPASHGKRANRQLAARVDPNFTGTTHHSPLGGM